MPRMNKEAREELIESAFYSLNRMNEAADRPTLTLVLGQTGTPTAAVQREVDSQRRPEGGALLVSGYDMDCFAAGEGFDASEVDTEALTLELAQRAMAERVNLVVTPSPTTEEMPLALIAAAKRNGYQVEVAALAVNPKVAATQTFQRALIPQLGTPDYSDNNLVREAANVAKVLRRIEANGAADHITLYDRHAQPVDRAPGQMASEAFEKIRGELSGAEKIRVAAAWEEVAEAFERNGDSLPENAQRMRQQAHYTLRQSSGASLVFDDRHSEHLGTSLALAEQYGQRLAKLFDAENKAAVSTYPELTAAFVTKNIADRLAQEKQMPEIATGAGERVRDALLRGRVIQPLEVKMEPTREAEARKELAEVER